MGFELFNGKHAQSAEPRITIGKSNITLNSACVQAFTNGAKYIDCYWDAQARKLGFKPTSEVKDTTYKLNFSNKGRAATFSGASLVQHINLEVEKSETYPATWNKEQALIEVKLSGPRLQSTQSAKEQVRQNTQIEVSA